jgi:hypothetical protein
MLSDDDHMSRDVAFLRRITWEWGAATQGQGIQSRDGTYLAFKGYCIPATNCGT